jgi:two-component sensor histidine kinase
LRGGGFWIILVVMELPEPAAERYFSLLLMVKDLLRGMNRSPDPEKIYRDVCASLFTLKGCVSVTIALLDGESRHYVPVAFSGEQDVDGAFDGNKYLELSGARGNGQIMEKDRSGAAGIHPAIVPLKDGNLIAGILIVRVEGTAGFSGKELSLLEELADELVLAAGRLRYIRTLEETGRTRRRAIKKLLRSLKFKDTLVSEVNHRTKNNLQVVSSLLNNYSRSLFCAQDRNLMEKCRNAMHSIVMIHEAIHKARETNLVALDEYLSGLIEYLSRLYSGDGATIVITRDLEPVVLDPDRALPLALIVNEIVFNALRHAFPGGRKGEIRVRLHEEGNNRAELQVIDNGIGFNPGPKISEKSLKGLNLVITLVGQINGEWEIRNDGGTAFSVRFPLSKPGPG